MKSMRAFPPVILGLSTALALAQASPPPPRSFLAKVGGFTAPDFEAMEKGDVVTKMLPAPQKAEIAALGVVRVTGSVDRFLTLAANPLEYRKVPAVPEIGLFSDPPKLEDLNGLTIPEDDLEGLKNCRPGKCIVKLGEEGLSAIQRIDWKAADTRAQATRLWKERLLAFVTGYAKGGTDAMGTILDGKAPKALSSEFRTLLANSSYLPEYVPEFNSYLEAYPSGKLEGVRDVLYWSKDTFGLKPVIAIYHVTAARLPGGVLVSQKQLYASHYFNAALEMAAIVPTQDAKGFYLVNVYRTRIDPPTGMLAGILMGKVRDGIETGVKENLKTAKSKTEAK
jgi:hypothetical protein